MNKKEKAEQKKRKMMKRKIMGIVEVVLRYAAAALMPSIPLFFLFNNNHEDNHIIFGHVLLLAAMLAIVGVLLLLLFKWIVKTHEGAIILSIAFWGLFWLYQPIRGVLGFLPAWLLLTIMLLIMAAATFCFRRFKISFRKLKSAFPVLFLAVIVIFGFNAIPAISAASTRGFGLGEGSAGVVDAMGNAPEFYIRREFVIDPALPNPDIYWIHLDGMTNLETVERFWGVCQQHVRDALAERGFLIYENAELRNAADTDTAITMLLSPALFDSYYGIHMANIEENLGLYVLIEIMTILRDDGIDLFTDILQHLELYNAFLAAGYEIEGVNEWMHILDVPRIAGAYIEASGLTGLWHDFLRTDLPNILTMTTPFNFANAQEAYRAEAANIIPDYEIDRPRLTWRAYYDAHGMFWYRVIPGFEGEAGD
ncbi:MAG: hypothetical protein LBE35_11170, partial [Clostridiales bacterium]|nr:hypothetical protein [Clostridiales bacterium]